MSESEQLRRGEARRGVWRCKRHTPEGRDELRRIGSVRHESEDRHKTDIELQAFSDLHCSTSERFNIEVCVVDSTIRCRHTGQITTQSRISIQKVRFRHIEIRLRTAGSRQIRQTIVTEPKTHTHNQPTANSKQQPANSKRASARVVCARATRVISE